MKTLSFNVEETDDRDAFGEWTFLKLLTLAYYIDVYTIIAKEHFDEIYYINLCAGEGLVKLRGIKEIIAGSALLGKIVPRDNKKFNKIILVENNSDKSLKLRAILPNAKVICEDANSVSVLSEIEKELVNENNNHYLAFVDPYTTDIDWKTIEFLLEIKGDLIINFMYSPVARIWGSYHSYKVNQKEREKKKIILDQLFGDESWLDIPPKDKGGSADDLLNLYISKIRQHREIVIPIAIKGLKGSFSYYMIVAIRKTKGSQNWVDTVEKVRDYVEKADDKFIKQLFSIYNQKQKTMNGFFT